MLFACEYDLEICDAISDHKMVLLSISLEEDLTSLSVATSIPDFNKAENVSVLDFFFFF